MSGLTHIERKRLARADRINFEALCNAVAGIVAARIAELEAQVAGLEAMNTEKAAEIRRLRMGNHPAGRALRTLSVVETTDEYEGDWPAAAALRDACEARDAEHESGGGA